MEIIGKVLKFILSLILLPFTALSNILLKPKSSIINFVFSFFSFGIYIQIKNKQEENIEDLLQESYIIYLARYFYICAPEQTEPVKDVILDTINLKNSSEILALKIYQAVCGTLTAVEQNALLHIFKLGLAPLTYINNPAEIRSSKLLGKYKLNISENNQIFSSILKISFGLDKMLLPLLLGVFFEYVMDNIKNETKKKQFINAIIRMLLEFEEQNPKELKTLRELPSKIIKSMSHIEVCD